MQALRDAFAKTNPNLNPNPSPTPNSPQALRDAFAKTEREFLNMAGVEGWRDGTRPQSNPPPSPSPYPYP